MKMIRICLIGTGRAGMIHARNFTAGKIPHAQMVAVADPVAAARAAACAELGIQKSFADYRDALKDDAIDAIVVATPTQLHRDICVTAAQAGKQILCEKPMAMTGTECEEMIAAARAANVVLQIGFMRRFDAGFVAAKERIDSGEIGEVVQIKSLTHGPSVPQPWMYDIRKSNGPLAEVNSHDIDTLRWFSGSEFSQLFALGGNYRCPDARAEFPDFYDNVILSARFRNGMQGVIGGAQGVGYGYDSRCEVLGTKGVLFVGSLAGQPLQTCTAAGMTTPVIKSWQGLFAAAYRAEDEDFIRCILENKPPRAGGEDGKRAVEIVNAGNESIRTGQPITLS